MNRTVLQRCVVIAGLAVSACTSNVPLVPGNVSAADSPASSASNPTKGEPTIAAAQAPIADYKEKAPVIQQFAPLTQQPHEQSREISRDLLQKHVQWLPGEDESAFCTRSAKKCIDLKGIFSRTISKQKSGTFNLKWGTVGEPFEAIKWKALLSLNHNDAPTQAKGIIVIPTIDQPFSSVITIFWSAERQDSKSIEHLLNEIARIWPKADAIQIFPDVRLLNSVSSELGRKTLTFHQPEPLKIQSLKVATLPTSSSSALSKFLNCFTWAKDERELVLEMRQDCAAKEFQALRPADRKIADIRLVAEIEGSSGLSFQFKIATSGSKAVAATRKLCGKEKEILAAKDLPHNCLLSELWDGYGGLEQFGIAKKPFYADKVRDFLDHDRERLIVVLPYDELIRKPRQKFMWTQESYATEKFQHNHLRDIFAFRGVREKWLIDFVHELVSEWTVNEHTRLTEEVKGRDLIVRVEVKK